MATRLTYRMTRTDDGYAAKCEELSVEATAKSPEGALDALRIAVTERLTSADAIGPPSQPPPSPHLELVPAIDSEPDPQGPGDSPAADQPSGS